MPASLIIAKETLAVGALIARPSRYLPITARDCCYLQVCVRGDACSASFKQHA